MSGYGVRIGVGTRFNYDGEVVEIIEVLTTPAGNEVVLKSVRDQSIRRMALRVLLSSANARVIPDGPGPGVDDDVDVAGVALAQLSDSERVKVAVRAEHVREVLTGYKSGHSELPRACPDTQGFPDMGTAPRCPTRGPRSGRLPQCGRIKGFGMTAEPAPPRTPQGWGDVRSRTVTWNDPARTTAIGLSMPGLDYLTAMLDGSLPPPPIAALTQCDLVAAEHGRVVFTCRLDESVYISRTSPAAAPIVRVT